jgi:GcrA cell cycle regulator
MPRAGITKWTSEQDAALKAHVARNELAYSAIVVDINKVFKTSFTRNAVIGRAKRIGCCNPARKCKRKNQYTTERVHAEPVLQGRAVRTARVAHNHEVAGSNPAPATSPAGAVRLIELGPCDCRYPVDEVSPFLFCGEPQLPNESYCPGHFRLTRRT